MNFVLSAGSKRSIVQMDVIEGGIYIQYREMGTYPCDIALLGCGILSFISALIMEVNPRRVKLEIELTSLECRDCAKPPRQFPRARLGQLVGMRISQSFRI